MNILIAIPVIFANGFTGQTLGKAALPTLPHPGDRLYLDTLAYQVTGHDWHLAPDGRVEITITLLPQVDQSGERPFSYPEEPHLPAIWGLPPDGEADEAD